MRDGPIQYTGVPTHPILLLTPRALQAYAKAKPLQVFKAGSPIALQVSGVAKLNVEVWFVVLFDGVIRRMAVLLKTFKLENMGIKDHLRNNLSAVMTYDGNELRKGDIIEVTQSCMLGEGDIMMMGLWNVCIIYRE